jgi:hypothetical protein
VVVDGQVYGHLAADRRRHGPAGTLPGTAERTVATGSAGKKFSVSGGNVENFPFPSRFGVITKTQHFLRRG